MPVYLKCPQCDRTIKLGPVLSIGSDGKSTSSKETEEIPEHYNVSPPTGSVCDTPEYVLKLDTEDVDEIEKAFNEIPKEN